jgi:DNA replication and repair protein RecF
MLVQVERGYAQALARYARALEQRNHLLKQVAAGEQPARDLEPWDMQLAQLGAEIVGARARAVAELNEMAAHGHDRVASGETLDISYEGPPADLALALRDALREDLRRGMTTVGPHRDDVSVRLNGQDARSFASQGQQRTAVVSLKLAESALVERRTGETPVLLLDDVLSELDLVRRAALLEEVSGRGQVIITSVDAAPFPGRMMSDAQVRCITAGRVQACD